MFAEPLKVVINKDTGKVHLSVRTTDNKVEVFIFDIPIFDVMMAQYQAQKEE